MKAKISVIQMEVVPGMPEINRQKASSLIAEAASRKPDIVILPEMWNTAYELKNIGCIADIDGFPTLELLKELAIKHDINIIGGSIANRVEDKVYNSAFIVNRKGETVESYNKIHLFGLMEEDKYLTAGNKECVFELDSIKCGLIICYDLRFPELSRKLALNDIKLLFVPAQWPKEREYHWSTLLAARAIENQIYIIAVNRAGRDEKDSFAGCSMVIDPWGEVMAKLDNREQICHIEVDLNKIAEVRSKIDIYKDRVPELY